jgi:hypothetical protein
LEDLLHEPFNEVEEGEGARLDFCLYRKIVKKCSKNIAVKRMFLTA